MTRKELVSNIRKKQSFLCIGLDPDMEKLPPHLLCLDDPVFEFNKQIIDATNDLAVAYKPNLAFYESCGLAGWQSLEKTIRYLNSAYPELFTIADAKRGDIGNTSYQYARAFLDDEHGLGFDAITIAPYMGSDSVQPFLKYEGKWAVILALTSNKGALDFQMQAMSNQHFLFESIIETAITWGSEENMMFVVGATQASMLAEIRRLTPTHFLLVPGIGAQGGSLQEVATYGLTPDVGLLVNASRSIIFASVTESFAEKARQEAKAIQQEMQGILRKTLA